MRKKLLGQRGYGRFRCGNCRWFSKPRQWGRKGEGPCKDLFSVDANQRPCPAVQKGIVGEFSPIDVGHKVTKMVDDLKDMNTEDLRLLYAFMRDREIEAHNEVLTSFCVGDHVQMSIIGTVYTGEVVAISPNYVTVRVGGSSWRLNPLSLSKL